MPHAVDLAVSLDEEMLARHGVNVLPFTTPDSTLPHCPDLAAQVGERLLIKYLRRPQRLRHSIMSGVTQFPGIHYITPTVLCADTLEAALNLPPADPRPRYALLLDPAKLDAYGPRRIRGGRGIEYLLLNGFTLDAIISPGWARPID